MNRINFTRKTREAMLLIRTAHPRIFPKLDQTKQQLELACTREGFLIIDIFYWYVNDPIRKDKIIYEIKKLLHKIIIVTNELTKNNQQILDLDKFAALKSQKIAKILLVDAENIIYQKKED